MMAVATIATEPTVAPEHALARQRLWEPSEVVSRTVVLMGGRVGIHLQVSDESAVPDAAATADRILRRIAAWANRLTRFTSTSELSRLNRDPRVRVPVGPTLAAVLDWGRGAEGLTDGIVDIGLLDARLAAEAGSGDGEAVGMSPLRASLAARSWSFDRRARGAIVRRPVWLRFDLDGIGKGWLADRALERLGGYAAAVVDADGDVAIRLDPGASWSFGVADPRRDGHDLAILRLAPRDGERAHREGRFGLATSGTSVHRWGAGTGVAHHLIDPRTGRSADTDVVQATVLAGTAREAEALAKSAVILGVGAGYDLLDRMGVHGAILLTNRDELIIHPSTLRWLA